MIMIYRNGVLYATTEDPLLLGKFKVQRAEYMSLYNIQVSKSIPFECNDSRFMLMEINGIILNEAEVEYIYSTYNDIKLVFDRLGYIVQYTHYEDQDNILEKYISISEGISSIDEIIEILNIKILINMIEGRC